MTKFTLKLKIKIAVTGWIAQGKPSEECKEEKQRAKGFCSTESILETFS